MRIAQYQRRDFGADLGGYLLKDRLWFFGAYDRVEFPAEVSRYVPSLLVSTEDRFPLRAVDNLYSGKLTANLSPGLNPGRNRLRGPHDEHGRGRGRPPPGVRGIPGASRHEPGEVNLGLEEVRIGGRTRAAGEPDPGLVRAPDGPGRPARGPIRADRLRARSDSRPHVRGRNAGESVRPSSERQFRHGRLRVHLRNASAQFLPARSVTMRISISRRARTRSSSEAITRTASRTWSITARAARSSFERMKRGSSTTSITTSPPMRASLRRIASSIHGRSKSACISRIPGSRRRA